MISKGTHLRIPLSSLQSCIKINAETIPPILETQTLGQDAFPWPLVEAAIFVLGHSQRTTRRIPSYLLFLNGTLKVYSHQMRKCRILPLKITVRTTNGKRWIAL